MKIPVKKKITIERNESILIDYNKGPKNEEAITKLAQQYEIGVSYIKKILVKGGLIPNKPNINIDARNKDIVKYYNTDKSIVELAEEFNLTPAYMRTLLQNEGVLNRQTRRKRLNT